MADESSGPRPAPGGRRRFPFTATGSSKKPALSRKASQILKVSAITTAALFLIGIAFGAGKWSTSQVSASVADPLNKESLDKFARGFVADMLDFNPETYKASQIRAMASMDPTLLQKYWEETNFPLSRRQLAGLPQGTTVMIKTIKQERTGPVTAVANVHADVVHGDSKLANAVNIKLKLGVTPQNTITVLEQEDVSGAPEAGSAEPQTAQ